MLNFKVIEETPLVTEPFPYMVVGDVISTPDLAQIAQDFPAIKKPGVFPLSELKYEGAFARLIDDVKGSELEALLSKKFNIELAGKPLMVTVRGHCQKKDGRIHNDSTDKIVTCLLYLNDSSWQSKDGRLRLLRDGHNLDNMIAEVPPDGGTFIAFQRTENSWHGHTKFEGPRRYIMFNWLISDRALKKNIGRHKLSAFFKKIGINNGY